MNTKYYRKYVDKLIDASPVNITITRKTYVDDGYKGQHESESKLPPQVVTFYKKSSQREVVSDAGQRAGYMISKIDKLLAKHNADIRTRDVFEYGDKVYRVSLVNEYAGICKQAELEVIG